MDFTKFMEGYARELGGQFSEYDKNRSVVIFPLEGNRFQTVLGVVKVSAKTKRNAIEFTSRVCSYETDMDLKELLENNGSFLYARFVIENGYIMVKSSAYLENVTEPLLKEMIAEVAVTADEWEFKLTGLDVH